MLPLRDAWREIRDEALRLTPSALLPYPIGEFYSGRWQVCGLFSPPYPGWSATALRPVLAANRQRCPLTTRLCAEAPGVELAAFSLLDPGCEIHTHSHPEGKFIAHLGLVVPDDCAITVEGETRAWREGELLVFDERSAHSAYNRSSERRVILLVDFDPAAKQ